jgi:signal transduction histidine kinase
LLSFARFGVQEADEASALGLRAYFENIEECGTGLLALLNDLLDLSRLEAGRMQLVFEELDLNDVVDTVQMEFEAAANERQMRFVLTGQEQLPAARIDRGRMVQVLRNLVSNALKFSPAGGAIEIERTYDDRFVKLAVKDRGIGIPAGELESIFDKFVQSTKTPTVAGGTGLGLAICRELIDAHGGRIWAQHRDGGGACLAFEVPRADRAPSTARADDLMELGISQSHATLPV